MPVKKINFSFLKGLKKSFESNKLIKNSFFKYFQKIAKTYVKKSTTSAEDDNTIVEICVYVKQVYMFEVGFLNKISI